MKAGYWAGCTFRYRFSEVVDAHLALLSKVGVDAALLDEEECCGDILLLAGLTSKFKENAAKVRRKLEGYELVVTGCAGCYHAFKNYAELGVSIPEVKHLSQLLASHLHKLKLKPSGERVAYHDPCELGRLSGEFEAPRAVLKAVAELVEPLAHGPEAACCGGGGGLWAASPELSVAIAEERIRRDVEPLGVTKLVTACPTCLLNLSIAAARRSTISGVELEVVDLGVYLLSKVG